MTFYSEIWQIQHIPEKTNLPLTKTREGKIRRLKNVAT